MSLPADPVYGQVLVFVSVRASPNRWPRACESCRARCLDIAAPAWPWPLSWAGHAETSKTQPPPSRSPQSTGKASQWASRRAAGSVPWKQEEQASERSSAQPVGERVEDHPAFGSQGGGWCHHRRRSPRQKDEFSSSGLFESDSMLVGHQVETCKLEPDMWIENLKEVRGRGRSRSLQIEEGLEIKPVDEVPDVMETKWSRGQGGSPSTPHPTDNRGRETEQG